MKVRKCRNTTTITDDDGDGVSVFSGWCGILLVEEEGAGGFLDHEGWEALKKAGDELFALDEPIPYELAEPK